MGVRVGIAVAAGLAPCVTRAIEVSATAVPIALSSSETLSFPVGRKVEDCPAGRLQEAKRETRTISARRVLVDMVDILSFLNPMIAIPAGCAIEAGYRPCAVFSSSNRYRCTG